MDQAEPNVMMDEMMACLPNRNWRWTESCHLFARPGHLEALHATARRIGLRRAWFQKHGKLPHYDLNRSRMEAARQAGVPTVSRERMVEVMGLWKRMKDEG